MGMVRDLRTTRADSNATAGAAARAKTGALVAVARDEVVRTVRRASRAVRLASPFLSLEVGELLVDAIRVAGTPRCQMLTALTGQATASGVLDPAALATLQRAGVELRSIPNLHAKLVLVDGAWGLLGSGNLTSAGLGGGNVLGVVLDRHQRAEASRYFDRWWAAA